MNKEKIVDINSIISKGSIDEKLFKAGFIKYIKIIQIYIMIVMIL